MQLHSRHRGFNMGPHIKKIVLLAGEYPTRQYYPFNQEVLQKTEGLEFLSPVTFFIGENGSGKSTLLEAIAHRCGIHIWQDHRKTRFEVNPYEEVLDRFISVEWTNGLVPGSYFSSEQFRLFAQNVEEWAISDPEMLKYFGGKSLVAQSHGQSLMSYFKARYRIKGLYLLDEPETALSPRSQLEFLKVLKEISAQGHAQFIIASHSPIILACPGAHIYSFDHVPVKRVSYEETDYYRIYKGFLEDRGRFLT